MTILLCGDTALAQCGVAILPGQTQSFSEAFNGGATPQFGSSNLLAVVTPSGGGSYDLAQNKMEAFSAIPIALPTVHASANAQINYSFCVPAAGANDTVSATISSQVYWNGILADASVGLSGNNQPSASILMTLVDFGTGGLAPPQVIATAAPPEFNTMLSGPSFYNVITLGGTPITQSASVVLNANVTVGHSYQVQYTLDCESPGAILGIDNVCDFGSDLGGGVGSICSGGCFAQVSSLSVSLGVDLNASILSVKMDVDGLYAQVAANRQAIEAASLTAERENAQLLGLLNEIKSLLSASQSHPPTTSTPTINPRPPIRPVNPAEPPVVGQTIIGSMSAYVFAVAPTSSLTSLTSDKNPCQVGDTVNFTALVAPVPPATATPTGMVDFIDGAVLLGRAALDSAGHATYTTSTLTAGTHQVTARYDGDSTFASSTSAAFTQTTKTGTASESGQALMSLR